MSLIICDLDGTLFNIDHRLHYLENKDWDGFWAAVSGDTPNDWCVELLTALDYKDDVEIVFVSGRNEVAREETMRQLYALGFRTQKLFMRPQMSRESDYKFKSDLFDRTPELYEADILFVLEDRQQVVDMYRAKGLTVLQCDSGDF